MEISVVIVTFNAKEITLKMLESLEVSLSYFKKQTSLDCEVVILDNKSTDGVLEEIKKKYSGSSLVKIAPNEENLGFSKGNNKALSHISKKSKFVYFLNPDLILEENTIYGIYELMKDSPKIGMSTCLINLPNGQIDIDCHRSFPTIWSAFCYFANLEKGLGKIFPKIFGRYHMLWEDFSKPHEIDACLGAFMAVRRDVGEKVSWWSEEYFLNGEDIDLCYKIKILEKYQIYFFPQYQAVHFKGSSKGTKKVTQKSTQVSDEVKNLQINSGIDAMKIFYQKFYAPNYSPILNQLVYFGMFTLKKLRLLLKRE